MTIRKIHKFIDEAGDPNFFGKGGTNIVGQEGVSYTFSLGMVTIKKGSLKNPIDIKKIREDIKTLALEIETNPYYKSIPSVQKRIKKYGKFIFHAKDDSPEIRKAFFDLLLTLPFTFQCSVGVNVGAEIDGKNSHDETKKEFTRPILIFKKLSHNTFLGVPMTSKTKTGSWYYPILFKNSESQLVLSQIKTFDSRRLQRKIGQVNENEFHKIKKHIIKFLSE